MDQLVIRHQLKCITQSKKFLLNVSTLMYQSHNAVKGIDGVDKDSVNVMFNSSKVEVDFMKVKYQ